MRTSENLVRHELIGLPVEVVESTNRTQVGLKGMVVDETRETLKIEKKDDNEAVVPKEGCVFVFSLPSGERVRIEGPLLVGRPEDRIKKRFRKW